MDSRNEGSKAPGEGYYMEESKRGLERLVDDRS